MTSCPPSVSVTRSSIDSSDHPRATSVRSPGKRGRAATHASSHWPPNIGAERTSSCEASGESASAGICCGIASDIVRTFGNWPRSTIAFDAGTPFMVSFERSDSSSRDSKGRSASADIAWTENSQ